jgi:redox-sensitive bicupin YhaK (pirin superfamily)
MEMIKIIKADKRHFSDFGWLKTYWLFSFSSYYDPGNIQFGALRVFNDDVVEPGTGFPTHPHEEMEIVTVVLEGEITHEDSMGNKSVIQSGDVQRMSAGTGLTHSEFNLANEPVHFYQIWILPDKRGLAPSYDQKRFDIASWKNALCPVASGQGRPDTVTFHTDATVYLADLEGGKGVQLRMKESRRVFVYVTSGDLQINGQDVREKDQARIDLENTIHIEAVNPASMILIDVPSCKGWGYSGDTLKGKQI